MTGVEYFRRKRRLNQHELSRRSGVSSAMIVMLERNGVTDNTNVSSILALADTLGIDVDSILAEYDPAQLEIGDRAAFPTRTASDKNAVAIYRREKNLSLDMLYPILGLKSRESARVACRRETAREKHVETLSVHEGITVDEFLRLYSPKGGK